MDDYHVVVVLKSAKDPQHFPGQRCREERRHRRATDHTVVAVSLVDVFIARVEAQDIAAFAERIQGFGEPVSHGLDSAAVRREIFSELQNFQI